MTFNRRQLLIAAAASAAPLGGFAQGAAAWPTKPVKLIVPPVMPEI